MVLMVWFLCSQFKLERGDRPDQVKISFNYKGRTVYLAEQSDGIIATYAEFTWDIAFQYPENSAYSLAVNYPPSRKYFGSTPMALCAVCHAVSMPFSSVLTDLQTFSPYDRGVDPGWRFLKE